MVRNMKKKTVSLLLCAAVLICTLAVTACGDSTYKDSVNQYKFREKIKSYYEDITVDEEAIKEFSIALVTPCYSF